MDFLTRRSIRKYQDREVEKEVIEELMKTAVVSPSGKSGMNIQQEKMMLV